MSAIAHLLMCQIKKNLLFLILLLIISSQLLIAQNYNYSTQNFYIVDTLPAPGTIGTHVKSVLNLNTCELAADHIEFVNPIGVTHSAPDITFSGWLEPGEPISYQINNDPINLPFLEGKIVYTGTTWPFGSAISGPLYAPETAAKTISVEYNLNTYILGEHISIMPSLDEGVSSLGILPAQFRPKGQMTFREGSFYYPSVNNQLVQFKVHGSNYWIRELGSLPDTIQYGGIFSVPHSCDSTTTYVLHHDPERGSTMYTLAIPSLELEEHCTMPYKPNAAAYAYESQLPPCDWVLDLDTNDDTTIHRYDTICTGTITLLDGATAFSPNLEADSLVLTITNPQDGAQEWLSINQSDPEVLELGNNSHRIRLGSTGFTKGESFLAVLDGLSYTNEAAAPTLGTRIISADLYHPYYGVLSARIEVLVTLSSIAAIPDITSPTCFGDTDGSINLAFSGIHAPSEVVWGDATLGTLNENLAPGNYTFQVTDGANCVLDDQVVLTEPDSLIVTIASPVDSICGNNGSLIPTVIGGTPAYTFNWSDNSTDSLLSNAAADSYELLVEDANGCQDMASYTLWELPALTAEYQEQSCLGEIITIAGENYTENATFELSLQTADGCDSLVQVQLTFADTFAQSFAYELCAGASLSIYDQVITTDTTFSVQLMSTAGCDSTEYYQVTLLQAESTLQAAICAGETYPFAGELLSTSGQYTDTLQTVDGCDSLIALDLTVFPNPVPEIISDGNLCLDASVTLSTTANYQTYQWSDNDTAASLLINEKGTYTITVTDANGCSGTASISLSDESPQFTYSIQQPACEDGVGQLVIETINGGTPPYQSQNSTPVVDGTLLGAYPLGPNSETIFDSNGCETTIDFAIVLTTNLSAALAETISIKLGESITLPLNIQGLATTINWSPAATLSCTACPNPVATPTQTSTYTVTITDDNGCEWVGNITVIVDFQGLYIPNAFSPNNDGNNDVFQPYWSDAVQELTQFEIYDRWGSQVYVATIDTPNWNGETRGQSAEEGVYVYFIQWKDKVGQTHIEQGELVLVR